MVNVITRLGYDVIRLAGEGAFGRVYETLNHKTQERIAAKVILKKNAKYNGYEYDDIKSEIKNEATVMSDFEGVPNVIQIKNKVKNYEDFFIFFMNYCNAGTLKTLLENFKKIDDEEVLAFIMKGVFDGLADLHAAEVAHMDIKPENIFINVPSADKRENITFKSLQEIIDR